MATHPQRGAILTWGALMSLRVGWITDTFPKRPKRAGVWLRSGAMLTMRCRNPMLYLNRMGFQNSFYRPDQNYDVVVIVKTFTDPVLAEVERLKGGGTKVIFDANVNYYYIWGDYNDPKTQPTPSLQRAAKQITRRADYVIADSEYLRDVVRDFNPRVVWIPDNVLTPLFRPRKKPRRMTKNEPLRLIWSGIAFKAAELLPLKPVFAAIQGLELYLVSEARPPVLDDLNEVIPTHWFKYSDVNYARLLGGADLIISPRYLNNGYNLGHTEYKLTLGMARGLAALASPQPAYISALKDGGGLICYTLEDWAAALTRLRDDRALCWEFGQAAQKTVAKRYATGVVVRQYAALFQQVSELKY